ERIGANEPPYTPVTAGQPGGDPNATVKAFAKRPLGFFKGRKPLWWVWWLIRAGALIVALVVFIVLLNNFYSGENHCSWCKYLSCLPIKDWCTMGDLTFKPAEETSPNRRDLLSLAGLA
ncbi:MAG: hypothetical protein M1833_007316, partial [Piccolia ochrophora]